VARSRQAVRTRASSSDAWYTSDELAASKPPGSNPLAWLLNGVTERMQADRDFLFKLASECSIDQVNPRPQPFAILSPATKLTVRPGQIQVGGGG
jgi:hypothetical protein